MSPIRLSLCAALPLLLLAAVPAHAQAPNPTPPNTMEMLRGGFAEVSGWIVKAGEMVPEERYNYRPTESVRTFGQMIGHIADGNNWYCRRAGGENVPWAEAIAVSGAGKAEMLAKLKESIDRCTAAHTAANEARSVNLLSNIGHASLHYGNLVTYLRMLGLTPPSS